MALALGLFAATVLAPLTNSTVSFAQRALSSVVVRTSSTVELVARDNYTSILTRDNSTSLLPRNNVTLSPLNARSNYTLISRSNSTLSGLARSAVPSAYAGAYPPVRMLARAVSTYTPCSGCMGHRQQKTRASAMHDTGGQRRTIPPELFLRTCGVTLYIPAKATLWVVASTINITLPTTPHTRLVVRVCLASI